MTAHQFRKCPSDCSGCMFCDGGLSWCEVCNKGESELADECPGPRKPYAYVSHPESDSAFPVYSEAELYEALECGLCIVISEYVCVMIEVGLEDVIDWDWDSDFENNLASVVEL